MKLKELKNVIHDDAHIAITYKNSTELPLFYNSWRECKNDLKKEAWNMEVTLNSNAGIEIVFDM